MSRIAAAGGDLLEVSRLEAEGIFGRDLEFSGLKPMGEPPAATAWADLRSAIRGGTQLLEDALPGEAGSEPLPLSIEDEDWMLRRD